MHPPGMALRPNWVDALYNLGKALTDQGNLDEAVACCRRTLELQPDYAEAYNVLGLAFSALGERTKPRAASAARWT